MIELIVVLMGIMALIIVLILLSKLVYLELRKQTQIQKLSALHRQKMQILGQLKKEEEVQA